MIKIDIHSHLSFHRLLNLIQMHDLSLCINATLITLGSSTLQWKTVTFFSLLALLIELDEF